MAGITVIPGHNPYDAWGQAMAQGVQGWSNNQMRNKLMQTMGQNHPLAQMMQGLPYNQAAQLAANYAGNQQMNPLQQTQMALNNARAQYYGTGGGVSGQNARHSSAQSQLNLIEKQMGEATSNDEYNRLLPRWKQLAGVVSQRYGGGGGAYSKPPENRVNYNQQKQKTATALKELDLLNKKSGLQGVEKTNLDLGFHFARVAAEYAKGGEFKKAKDTMALSEQYTKEGLRLHRARTGGSGKQGTADNQPQRSNRPPAMSPAVSNDPLGIR